MPALIFPIISDLFRGYSKSVVNEFKMRLRTEELLLFKYLKFFSGFCFWGLLSSFFLLPISINRSFSEQILAAIPCCSSHGFKWHHQSYLGSKALPVVCSWVPNYLLFTWECSGSALVSTSLLLMANRCKKSCLSVRQAHKTLKSQSK